MFKRTRSLVLACAALVLATTALGQMKMTIVELAVETDPGSVNLPTVRDGVLVVTPCTGCTPMSLRATAASKYFVGKQEVTLAQMRDSLRKNRDAQLVVLYHKDTKLLTRVIASAPPALRSKS